MLEIPVTFTHQNKTYSGILSRVAGAGDTSTYHLTVNKFYFGRLRKAHSKWVFDSTPNFDISHLSEFFGDHVTNWAG